jgi:hypothetical protein
MTIAARIRRRLLPASLALGAMLTLGGCFTLSVNPLYTPEQVAQDPGLLGVWGNPEDPDSETWQFLAGGNEAMRLVIRQEDTLRIKPERDGLLTAHLVRLDGAMYLDLYPEEPDDVNEIFLAHVIPAHSFWKLDREGDTLTLYALDSDALEKAFENGRIAIDHVKQDDLLVLTAPVTDLQDLIVEDHEWLFTDAETLQRIQ